MQRKIAVATALVFGICGFALWLAARGHSARRAEAIAPASSTGHRVLVRRVPAARSTTTTPPPIRPDEGDETTTPRTSVAVARAMYERFLTRALLSADQRSKFEAVIKDAELMRAAWIKELVKTFDENGSVSAADSTHTRKGLEQDTRDRARNLLTADQQRIFDEEIGDDWDLLIAGNVLVQDRT